MKRLFFICLLLNTEVYIFGQSEQIDSLKINLAHESVDTNKFELIKSLFSWYTQFDADSALVYAEKLQFTATALNDSLRMGMALDAIGRAHMLKHNNAQSLDYFIRASDLFLALKNKDKAYDIEALLARLYIYNEEYDLAKHYLGRAYTHFKKTDNTKSLMVVCIRYCLLYEKAEVPDSNLYYAQEAFSLGNEIGSPRYMLILENNLAGAFTFSKKYKEALLQYRKVLNRARVQDPSSLDHAAYGMASTFKALGQFDSCLHYSLLTIDYARDIKDIENESAGYLLASESYANLGNYKKAYSYNIIGNTQKDSTFKQLYDENLNEYKIKYESELKDKTIAKQELELVKQTNSKRLAIFLGISLFLFSLLSFFFIRSIYQAKRKTSEIRMESTKAEKERLEELSKIKSSFFSNISHEFRTPLTLLLNPLKDLKAGRSDDIDSYLDSMIYNGERMVRLINQLLELSKLDDGIVEVKNETIELNSFFNVLIQSFESWTLQKQILYNYKIPEGLIYFQSDLDKLEKIFNNLISNAVKNTPKNGRIKVSVDFNPKSEKSTEGELQVIVQNSNSYIPADQIPHLFNRYFSKETGGMGIGLALSKELVELLNGTISVDSSEVSGTTFKVELLLLKTQVEQEFSSKIKNSNVLANPEPVNLLISSHANDLTKQSILVVEDNLELQHYMKNNLSSSYNVFQALNGKTGLEIAVREIPDIIISDAMMPEMDGLSFVKLLRGDEKTNHIPIIMLTARSSQTDKLSGIELGVDSYMTKPFDLSELYLQIENKLDQQKRLRQKFAKSVIYISKEDPSNSNLDSFINKAVQIVIDHLDEENFNGDKLATLMTVSPSQLYRKLKSTTDHSPAIFIRKIRLQKAYEMLNLNKGNISEISAAVGIPNLAYFSRTFSKEFGHPPSQLIKNK